MQGLISALASCTRPDKTIRNYIDPLVCSLSIPIPIHHVPPCASSSNTLSYAFVLCPPFRFRTTTIVLHFYWWAALLFFTTYPVNPAAPRQDLDRNWAKGRRLDRSFWPVLSLPRRFSIPYPHTHISVRHVSLSPYTASVRLLLRIISVMTNDINGTHLPVPLLMRRRKSNWTAKRDSF